MNPSTALARVLVDELLRCGVRDVVLCPGSRNAPLSFALHEAATAGRCALHVRIDERSAAFVALGLALRSGRPVPVVCTSGTAVANLHPAVLEAAHAGVPLLALTADRPPDLVGTGANQTVAQHGIFAGAVRYSPALDVPQRRGGQQARWRSTVDRAVAAARGTLGGRPGPVHLDVALPEPLVPEPDPDWPESLDGRQGGAAWTVVPPAPRPAAAVELDLSRPTVAVAGHGAPPAPAGVPLVAEPTAASWPDALVAGPWLLAAPGMPRPEQVLVLGRPTLHRPVGRLLADPDVAVTVVTEDPQWADVAGTAVAAGTELHSTGTPDREWRGAWAGADATAAKAVESTLDGTSGMDVARRVVAAIPDGALLVLGSSNPIRDVALAAVPRAGLAVLANRGVSGIDGTVGTAIGAALVHRAPSYALLGDLTFLHDANGLLLGPAEARPDLTIVVANDDGGGIFGLLEQGGPEHAAAFERVFATPHGTDLAALCAAHRVPHTLVTTDELSGALAPQPGLRVLEVRTERSGLRTLHARVRDAVSGSWSAAAPRRE